MKLLPLFFIVLSLHIVNFASDDATRTKQELDKLQTKRILLHLRRTLHPQTAENRKVGEQLAFVEDANNQPQRH